MSTPFQEVRSPEARLTVTVPCRVVEKERWSTAPWTVTPAAITTFSEYEPAWTITQAGLLTVCRSATAALIAAWMLVYGAPEPEGPTRYLLAAGPVGPVAPVAPARPL